jgi:hypothetical protein
MICRRYGEALDDATPADNAKFVRLQNEWVYDVVATQARSASKLQ